MTEENTPNDGGTGHDLRTVIPRLEDLQRKCRSVGSRNDEATEIEERIGSILNRLQPPEDSDSPVDADTIPFAALARELYSVERFFESNGFLTVAKEVAHVERTLESFASPDESKSAAHPAAMAVTSSDTEPEDLSGVDTVEAIPGPPKWAVPKPLATVGFFFLVAIVVCIVIIVRHEYAPMSTVGKVTLQPAVGPTVPPRRPTTIPNRAGFSATPAPGAILAEAVGKARLALSDGDIDRAIDHLSQAALVDSDHATVLGTANQIVDLLVDRANAAVDRGLWEIADLTLARAGRIATRFGLDTFSIDQAAHRHAQLERFILIKPGDADAIRAATGRRVTVFFKDGSTRKSVIKGTQGGRLLLDQDTTVRGGAVYYTEKVPLGDIDYLKVWDD